MRIKNHGKERSSSQILFNDDLHETWESSLLIREIAEFIVDLSIICVDQFSNKWIDRARPFICFGSIHGSGVEWKDNGEYSLESWLTSLATDCGIFVSDADVVFRHRCNECPIVFGSVFEAGKLCRLRLVAADASSFINGSIGGCGQLIRLPPPKCGRLLWLVQLCRCRKSGFSMRQRGANKDGVLFVRFKCGSTSKLSLLSNTFVGRLDLLLVAKSKGGRGSNTWVSISAIRWSEIDARMLETSSELWSAFELSWLFSFSTKAGSLKIQKGDFTGWPINNKISWKFSRVWLYFQSAQANKDR